MKSVMLLCIKLGIRIITFSYFFFIQVSDFKYLYNATHKKDTPKTKLHISTSLSELKLIFYTLTNDIDGVLCFMPGVHVSISLLYIHLKFILVTSLLF